MRTLLLTGQIAASLLGQSPSTPAAQSQATLAVLSPAQAFERLALSRAGDPAVRIELGTRQARNAPVRIPAHTQYGDLTLATTTRPGPSGWGVSLKIFARLPGGAGRLDLLTGVDPFFGEDFNTRRYAPSAPAPSPGPQRVQEITAYRSLVQGFLSLGWSRDLWLRRSWAVRGEVAYRAAFVTRDVSDDIVGQYPVSSDAGTAGGILASYSIDKRSHGVRAGLTLRVPLLAGATAEVGGGCGVSSVSETCEGWSCGEEVADLHKQRRLEALPDLTLRLRIPAGDHIELSGGYRWESWGRDSFDSLRTSGAFFTLGVLIGPAKR